MFPNCQQLAEVMHPVLALPSVVPSSSTPKRVSMKNYNRVLALIEVANATTVTGSAITLKQSQDVSGTGEKALSFTTMWSNIDTAAADALARNTVSSDTFTTDATNSKNLLYLVEVKAADLDVANGFDVFRVGTANATAATVTVTYLLYGARYENLPESLPGALAD